MDTGLRNALIVFRLAQVAIVTGYTIAVKTVHPILRHKWYTWQNDACVDLVAPCTIQHREHV